MTTRTRPHWSFCLSAIPIFFMLHIVMTCIDTMGLIEYEYAEAQRRSTRR